ncbi:hypothetical protein ACS25C_00035 (plasmid) [Dickeya undicola]|uniref:hypothetical protein n=1 Tax=Dickeya TaxID=204037 RepID=UPI001AEC8E29|nr:hypothetical protein [Dickeya oryzae]
MSSSFPCLSLEDCELPRYNHNIEFEDLIDQCRALIYAVLEIPHPSVREVLSFLLQERIDALFVAFHQEDPGQSQTVEPS